MKSKAWYYLAIVALVIVQAICIFVNSSYIVDPVIGNLFLGSVLMLCLYVEVCIIYILRNDSNK